MFLVLTWEKYHQISTKQTPRLTTKKSKSPSFTQLNYYYKAFLIFQLQRKKNPRNRPSTHCHVTNTPNPLSLLINTLEASQNTLRFVQTLFLLSTQGCCKIPKMPMDRVQPSTSPDQKSPTVLSIECLKGTSTADEWTGDFLQTGDIVEELRIGSSGRFKSPFKNGKSGVQKVLHESFKKKETSILVRVRRGVDEFAELQACIVPNDSVSQKKQYMLRSIADPNYAVGFLDRSESDCLQLQGE